MDKEKAVEAIKKHRNRVTLIGLPIAVLVVVLVFAGLKTWSDLALLLLWYIIGRQAGLTRSLEEIESNGVVLDK